MKAVDINTIDDNGDPELFARFVYDGIKIITLFSVDPIATNGWLADGFEMENIHGNIETINGGHGVAFLNILKQVFDGFYMRAGNVYDLTEQQIKNKILEYGTETSGFYGHAGRPGELGGSASKGTGTEVITGDLAKQWPEYANAKLSKTEKERLKKGLPQEVIDRHERDWGKLAAMDTQVRLKKEADRLEYVLNGPEKIDYKEDKMWRDSKTPFAERNGSCYQLAAKFVVENEGWTLVHATLYPRIGPHEDRPFFHGYATKGNVVYDAVFDKFFNKKSFYEHYNVTDERSYQKRNVYKMAFKHKHWGSWE